MDHGPDFYRSLIDHLHDGVYFVDPGRTITCWNRAVEAIAGYAAAEMVGRHCADGILMHVDKAGASLCRGGCPLHRVIGGEAATEQELFLRHKNGHRVPIIVRASPVRDAAGAVIGAFKIGTGTGKDKIYDQVADQFTAVDVQAYTMALMLGMNYSF
ncbi:MAG: PAS domain S-box protein [Planctomycetota bacterium]